MASNTVIESYVVLNSKIGSGQGGAVRLRKSLLGLVLAAFCRRSLPGPGTRHQSYRSRCAKRSMPGWCQWELLPARSQLSGQTQRTGRYPAGRPVHPPSRGGLQCTRCAWVRTSHRSKHGLSEKTAGHRSNGPHRAARWCSDHRTRRCAGVHLRAVAVIVRPSNRLGAIDAASGADLPPLD